jgi:hypothetical protein
MSHFSITKRHGDGATVYQYVNTTRKIYTQRPSSKTAALQSNKTKNNCFRGSEPAGQEELEIEMSGFL